MLAQLEGSGRGNLASYNAQGYSDLSGFMEENPLRDGDEWLGLLMKRNEMLGAHPVRVSHELSCNLVDDLYAVSTHVVRSCPFSAAELPCIRVRETEKRHKFCLVDTSAELTRRFQNQGSVIPLRPVVPCERKRWYVW